MQPAQRLAEVAPPRRWPSQVVSDQPDVMLVVLLFGRLQSQTKLALGCRPVAHCYQTQPTGVAAFSPHDGCRFGKLDRAVQIFKGRLEITAPPRNCGERMPRFGFSFA